MTKEVDLGIQAFEPMLVESAGAREESNLRKEYGSASEQGIRGTLLPNAVPGGQGASMGFDPNAPMVITVDPDIPGGAYQVKPGSTPLDTRKPLEVPAGGYNDESVRQVASRNMRAAVGAAQPQSAPLESLQEEEEVATARKPVRRKKAGSSPVKAQPVQSDLPMKVIAFDFGPPMGTMETRYHDIFRDGNRLVLAWDINCVTAGKYTPAKMDIPVRVIVGREREEYTVYSLGIEFIDETTERQYIILLIDMGERHGEDGAGK